MAAGGGGFGGEEGFEDSGEVFGGDSRAGVGDVDGGFGCVDVEFGADGE